MSWEKGSESIALLSNGTVVWRFNHGPTAAKPYFHPIALPGGPVLTWDRPADHRWHRALWFSWKYINGINYWEEDPATGKSEGKTDCQIVSIDTTSNYQARIVLRTDYHPPGGPVVLTEHRTIEIGPPAGEGQYHMDWDLVFTAGDKDVLLDRTPLPNEKDGKPYGGYAGLSVRFAQEIQEPQATTLDGPVTFQGGRFRGKSKALDYSGLFGGVLAGIAILDHPMNLNAPSPWYVINDGPMHYYSPAVLCYGPHRLKPGEILRLRYRVIVHPNRWTAQKLKDQLPWDRSN